MSNRTITVVLEINDNEQASVLWQAHIDNSAILGCKVRSLGEGNFIKKVSDLEDMVSDILDIAEDNRTDAAYKIVGLIEVFDKKTDKT